MTWNIYLKGHNAGVRAIFVDLIHGSLQSYSLLREILQILRTLLGLLMGLAHLTGGKNIRKKTASSQLVKLKCMNCCGAYLVLINGVTLLLVL